MLRSMGVVCLWILLIAVPHVRSPALELSVSGFVPSAAVAGDDPIDTNREGPAPARAAVPGSFATIHFKNALGKTFTLLEASVTMDGKTLPAIIALDPGGDSVVFAGRVAPGEHVLNTHLTCQGRRRGPFTYLDEYKWEVGSDEVLKVPPERAVIFTISAVRRKGANVPWDKQVGITVEDVSLPAPVSLER